MMKRKGNTVGTRVARQGEWLAFASLALAIAGALPDHAAAASYTVSNQAQLVGAINAANADSDPSATITLTGNIALNAGTLPSPTKPMTIDTQGFTLSGATTNTVVSFVGTGGTVTFAGNVLGGTGTSGSTEGGIGLLLGSTTVPSSVINNGQITGGTGASTGGVGGNAVLLDLATFTNNGALTGGASTGASNGIAAASISHGTTLTNYGTIVGGTAQGGIGGTGVTLGSATGTTSTLINYNVIKGGESLGGAAGGGAITGVGVGGSIINSGTIEGGTGVAAIASNAPISVINSGTISAGTGQANAIAMGANVRAVLVLQLQAGSIVNGNVVANAAATTDTLILGGNTNATFDVSSIGPASQYQNFDIFQKTGTSTWSLTGTGTVATPWDIQQGTLQVGNGGTSGSFIGNVTNDGTLAFNRSDAFTFSNVITGSGSVSQVGTGTTTLSGTNAYIGGTTIAAGTLSISNDANLGDAAGSVSFTGGTLETTADITSARTVALNGTGTFATDTGTALTLNGVVSGNGGLVKAGAGTLVLTATNTYTGGTTVNSGLLQIGNGGSNGSVVGDVVDNGALAFDRSDAVTFGGVVSGNGTLTQLGTGALVLTRNNTYTGGTTISSGSLQIGNGGTSGSIVGNVVDNGTLVFDRSDDVAFAGAISGSGALTKLGTDTLVLIGNNTYAGTTTIGGGILQIGNGGTSGTITGNIVDNGTLAFDRSDAITFSDVIGGSGSVSQLGAGTTTLTGINTYTGGTSIAAGTLSISSDVNLGDVTGGLTFIGGTLETSATVATARTVVLNGTGTFAPDAGTTLTLNGVVSGNGGLVKAGSGALVLTAANTYIGGTTISGGSLQIGNGGTSGSIVGNVADNGTLVFDRSDGVTFGGVVSGSGALTKLGTNKLVLTGDNTYAGITTISGGSLQIGNGGTSGSITGNVVDNGALVFDRSNAVSFNGSISGTGGIDQIGNGTTTLTGASSYTGATNVIAGVLAVNGSIAHSAVTVASGATLAGTGTVGATTVQAGGTIAPSGMGTLSVNGNYAQASGSTYQVTVNPTSSASGRIAVTGTATLESGATIQVTKMPNLPYVVGNKYTVLTAAAGVTGAFNLTGQTDVSAFLALTGSYDANDAYLTVMQTSSPTTVATTPNQTATGNGLGSAGQTAPATTAVLNSATANAARDALDKLSGEVYASAQTALQEDSEFARNAVTGRLRDAFCAVGGSASMQGGDNQPRDGGHCTGNPDQLVTWGQVFGSWGYNGGNGNAAKLDHSAGGLLIGADTPVAGNWRMGVMAGYGRSGFDVNARNSSSSSDDDYFGVYGGTQWGALGFRTGATYTWHDIGSNRILNLPGLPGSVGADYHAGSTQVFGDLGYRIDAGNTSFEPFANLAYARLHVDGFTENGGGAALISRSENMNTTFTTFGVRASNTFKVDGAMAAVHASLGWRHVLGDVTPQSEVAFADGNDFDITGVAIARNAGLVDFGLDVHVTSNATFGVAYFGEYGSGAVDQGVKGTLQLTF